MIQKLCKHCNLHLNIDQYRQCKYKNGKIYYKSICKKSESIIQVERRRKNGLTDLQKQKIKSYKKNYIQQLKNAIQYGQSIIADTNNIEKINKNLLDCVRIIKMEHKFL